MATAKPKNPRTVIAKPKPKSTLMPKPKATTKSKASKNPIADLKKQQAKRDAGINKTIKGLSKKKTLGGDTY